jgi:phosphoglycolate phosphatase-like HAD superfamily hydrolase
VKLVLFDIDGTLIDSGGAGTRSLETAFREAFSIKGATGGVSMAGKTDLQIVREILDRHGLPNRSENVKTIIDAYVEGLRKEIYNPGRHVKPGVRELLDRLYSIPDIYTGLLTGNVENGAEIKLAAFGLNRYFSLNGLSNPLFGAFGSDDEDRNRLLPICTEKFKALTGIEIGHGNCVVVGDTPKDIACAKPYGAIAVTVATGSYSAGELEAAGADVSLSDFTDKGALKAILA